jgi:uncharacterized protein (DUF1810 family)
MADASGPYGLNRFVQAQEHAYKQALSEVKKGRKVTYWMRYIFPQFDGLGFSSISRLYSIESIAEAEAYLAHPVLTPRLTEPAEATLRVEGRFAHDIFGSPDDMKLRSCVTLFGFVSPPEAVFDRLLDSYFQGQPDQEPLRFLGSTPDRRAEG